jgi:alpha-galactosidase
MSSGSMPMVTDRARGEATVDVGAVKVSVSAQDPTAIGPPRLVGWSDSVVVLEVVADRETAVEVTLVASAGDAVGFWHPDTGWARTLQAHSADAARVSLVNNAAAGCLFDYAGRAMLAFISAEFVEQSEMTFRVPEETMSFEVRIRPPIIGPSRPYRIGFATGGASLASSMRQLRTWLRSLPGPTALPTPDSARQPLYSTWYAFVRDVRYDTVEAELEIAAGLGCGAAILDDGWQQYAWGRGFAGCGDWLPDPAKFPDLAEHVRRVHSLGLRYLVWIAPLLVGERADVYERMYQYAPLPARPFEDTQAYVLDPRLPEVRDFVIKSVVRVVHDYKFDGVKLDFLDQVQIHLGRPALAGADIEDVGSAMQVLLSDLRAALEVERAGEDLLIELRQPYLGPGMLPYGNMLRSADNPGDAVANRIRTVDVGLLAVNGAVHADMLMWNASTNVQSAARQIIGTLHAVPQLSVRLTQLPPAHLHMLAFWLRQWQRLRPLLLDGDLEPGRSDEMYPIISASAGDAKMVIVHADRVVAIDTENYHDLTLVNGTATDHIVLHVTGRAVPTTLTVYNSVGQIINHSQRVIDAGLITVAIPPSGLARIRPT